MEKDNKNKIISSLFVYAGRYYLLISATIFIAFSLFYILFFLQPIYKKHVLREEEIKAKFELVRQEKLKANRELSEIEAKLSMVDTNMLGKIDELLPSSPNALDFFHEFFNRMRTEGFLLSSISFDEAETKKSKGTGIKNVDKLGERVYSIDLIGPDFKRFRELLEIFEKNLRLIDVHSIALPGPERSISLKFSMYYFKNE